MDRQRLMPAHHWGWRGEQWSTIAQGWRVGNLVFVGGQVALDEDGEIIGPGDIAAQTRAVYLAIQRVLREAGAELSDVVKINYLVVTDAEGEEYDEFWRQMARSAASSSPKRRAVRHGRDRVAAGLPGPPHRGRVHRGDPGVAPGGEREPAARHGAVFFSSAAEFRAWLEVHHATSSGLWLGFLRAAVAREAGAKAGLRTSGGGRAGAVLRLDRRPAPAARRAHPRRLVHAPPARQPLERHQTSRRVHDLDAAGLMRPERARRVPCAFSRGSRRLHVGRSTRPIARTVGVADACRRRGLPLVGCAAGFVPARRAGMDHVAEDRRDPGATLRRRPRELSTRRGHPAAAVRDGHSREGAEGRAPDRAHGGGELAASGFDPSPSARPYLAVLPTRAPVPALNPLILAVPIAGCAMSRAPRPGAAPS